MKFFSFEDKWLSRLELAYLLTNNVLYRVSGLNMVFDIFFKL